MGRFNVKKYFISLFEYEFWANKKILTALETNTSSKEIMDLFSHMLADMKPWVILLRKEGFSEKINCQPSWNINQCGTELDELRGNLSGYLNSATAMEFGNIIESKGSKGQIFRNTVADVLTHIASHSEYHRGQIEMLIRKKTNTFLPLSHMYYLRESTT